MQNTLKILKILGTLNALEDEERDIILSSIMKGNTADRFYLRVGDYLDKIIDYRVTEAGLEIVESYERND